MIRKNSNILVQKSNICNAMISYPDFAHTYSHKHTHSNTHKQIHTHTYRQPNTNLNGKPIECEINVEYLSRRECKWWYF